MDFLKQPAFVIRSFQAAAFLQKSDDLKNKAVYSFSGAIHLRYNRCEVTTA